MGKVYELGRIVNYPDESEIDATISLAKSGDQEAKQTLFYWLKYCPLPQTKKDFELSDKIFDAIAEFSL